MIFGTSTGRAWNRERERVALWSIVRIMKPRRDFSLFNWRPQTISRMTDCEIPFGSEGTAYVSHDQSGTLAKRNRNLFQHRSYYFDFRRIRQDLAINIEYGNNA